MSCTICGDKGTICYEGKITDCACQGDPYERIAALQAENARLRKGKGAPKPRRARSGADYKRAQGGDAA